MVSVKIVGALVFGIFLSVAVSSAASAQCNGQLGPESLCGNPGTSQGPVAVTTSPVVSGTFTANGTSEVATSGTFDVGATVLMSLKSTGTTPCAGLPPYFDKTQIANTFYTKAGTASCNDVYNWVAYGQVH